MSERLVYINGKFVPKSEASVSVFDHGLLYGDGVFEGIRAYGDEVFKLDEHLERLYRSAHFLRIDIGIPIEKFREALLETLKVNNLYEGAYIRPVVTRGTGDLGINPKKCNQGATVIIIADQITLYPPAMYEKGIVTMICSTRKHNPQCLNPQVKATQYLNNIMALIEANMAGFVEAIMLSLDGFITEGSADNIFIARGKRIVTPPAYLGALQGITRDSVMEVASGNGYTVEEKRFTSYDLYEADECWFTGTAAELIPVIEVDSRKIGTGAPGPVFKDLKSKFGAYVKKHGTKIPR